MFSGKWVGASANFAKFYRADLSSARLDRADLGWADLRMADLTDASLAEASSQHRPSSPSLAEIHGTAHTLSLSLCSTYAVLCHVSTGQAPIRPLGI